MLFHLLVMTAYNTVHGSSGGHGLETVLGERLHDGGDATACAVVASRSMQGHHGPCDVFWRVGRGVLGSFGPFLDPGGISGIIAIPPLVEPTFCAGQLPTDVLDLVFGTGVVERLVTTVFGALGQRRCLSKLSVSVSEPAVFSMS